MVLSAIVWLPVALASLPVHGPPADAVASLLALGAGGTGIAFLFFYKSIAEVGPARASVVAYVAPAFAVVYGATLLGEAVTAGTIAGLALILAGSWLAARGGRDVVAEPAPVVSRSGPSRSSAPEPARVR
jgi:drug/metabolite transporter (DMT)-like permease